MVATGTASWELSPPGEDEIQARFHAIAGAGFPYLVAMRDGAIIGSAYASAYHPRPGYRHTVEDSVHVAPDGQGRGAGRMLLAALIDARAAAGSSTPPAGE